MEDREYPPSKSGGLMSLERKLAKERSLSLSV